MRHLRRQIVSAVVAGAVVAGTGAVAWLALPVSATEPTDTSTPPSTAAPVVASESVTTLPLFGAPLTVDVSTTPSGALDSVAVTPAAGLTGTKVRSNQVAFVNEAGTGKVRVEARRGSDKVGVTASALSDILGPGSWSGDVFGTGATTTVTFQIVAGSDGGPDITGITTGDSTAKIGDVQHNSDPHVQSARATITFTSGIQTRRVTIAASVFTVNGTTKAGSQVLLSKVIGTSLPADQAAGEHTWSGMLCDGSTATVAYSVAADGTITAGAVTPASAKTAVKDNVLHVMLSDTESLSIVVTGRDGNLRISANPRLFCGRTTPSVNTPTSTNPPRPPRSTPVSPSFDPTHNTHVSFDPRRDSGTTSRFGRG